MLRDRRKGDRSPPTLYLLVPVDVRELTTPSEANSTGPGGPTRDATFGFPPSPAFSRTDDGARDAARTAALYATTTLSPCE